MTPIPLDPGRFSSAAEFYESGRPAYAAALIRRVAAVTALTPAHRVLDLGCGPAPLARAFAPLVHEVVAMDPSAEMLGSARALAATTPNIRFLAASSYDLDPALAPFHLVVMGRSFHWMDRVDTLRRLDRMIAPGGAVALFHDSAPDIPANAWRKPWRDLCDRYTRAESNWRPPDWVRHEAILLDSPFSRLESFTVIERRPIDVKTLVHRTLSLSSTSPSHLGEDTGAMLADLRATFADLREEVIATSALVAWRP